MKLYQIAIIGMNANGRERVCQTMLTNNYRQHDVNRALAACYISVELSINSDLTYRVEEMERSIAL